MPEPLTKARVMKLIGEMYDRFEREGLSCKEAIELMNAARNDLSSRMAQISLPFDRTRHTHGLLEVYDPKDESQSPSDLFKEEEPVLTTSSRPVVFEQPRVSFQVDTNRDFKINVHEMHKEEVVATNGKPYLYDVPVFIRELIVKVPDDLEPNVLVSYEIDIRYADHRPGCSF